jgi:hypothetical protein
MILRTFGNISDHGIIFQAKTKRNKYNPVRISLAKAGASLGEYGYSRLDGTIDFNTYENLLEGLEKPANVVFDKIRNFQALASSDRESFAEYMTLMMRRVPARNDLVAEQFPKVVEAEKANLEELVANAHSFIDQSDVQEVTFFNKYFEARRNLLDEYERNGMPRELQLRSIVESDMPQVRMTMLSMTWQLFVAPDVRSS